MRVATKEELGKWMVENLHTYFCDDCDERFHIERIEYPSSMQCPFCGGRVAINSEDYKKLK